MRSKVIWSPEGKQQLRKIYFYIRRDSLNNSEKIRVDILSKAQSLALHSERYPLDKDKEDNDGSYRCFTLYN